MLNCKLKNEPYTNSKGEWHRLDGPAIEYLDGGKEWWINGKLSRVDGPAIEFSDRLNPRVQYKHWALININLKEEEFNSWTLRIRKFLFLF